MNLDCPELIADYHKRANAKAAKRSSEIASLDTNNHSATNNNLSTNSNKRSGRESIDQEQQDTLDPSKKSKRANDFGYGRGLEIERILGATDVYGELMFL